MAAAIQYAPTERAVYQAAVELSRTAPDGFDATQLAAKLGCDLEQAQQWLAWLRRTGDFAASSEVHPR